MSLSSKEHLSSDQEIKNILKEFPMLERIRNSTREKIRGVLKGAWESLGQWFRKKMEKHLPGLLSKPEESLELPQSSFPETEEDIRQRDALLQGFAVGLNHYRKNSGVKELKVHNGLMSLAEKVAGSQVHYGATTHTSEKFRRKNTIDGEIIASGFTSPQAALKQFVESEKHYKALMGSHTEMGYAIRPGVEAKSGQTMYYLVVLFRGGKSLDYEAQVPKKPIEIPIPEFQTLEDALQYRPGLKPYFSSFEQERKIKDPQLTYKFSLEGTLQLPPQEKAAGFFYLTFSKDGNMIHYKVRSSPARLSRLNTDKKIVQIRFEDLFEDFAKAVREKKSSKSNTPNAKEQEKVKEPEVMGLS